MMKLLGKIFIGIIIFIFAIIGISLIVFAIYQEKILKYAIKTGLEKVDPTITTGEIHVSNLNDYPYLTVGLDDLHVPGTYASAETSLAECEHLEIVVDLSKLIKGELTVDTVKLSNSNAFILIDKSGKTNFDFGSKEEKPVKEKKSKLPEIKVEEIFVELLNVKYVNEQQKHDIQLTLDTLHTSFLIDNDHIHVDPFLHLLSEHIQIDTSSFLPNTPLHFKGGVNFGFENTHIALDTALLQANDIRISLDGDVIIDSIPYLNLSGKIDKDTLSEFIALVPEGLLEPLKAYEIKGQLGFQFEVKGYVDTTQIPNVTAAVEYDNGEFYYSEKDIKITDIQFNAKLTTGDAKDLQQAYVSISPLKLKFKGNSVNGRVEAQNLKHPLVNTKLQANVELSSLKDLLEKQGLQEAMGNFVCDVTYRGSIKELQGLRKFPEGTIDMDHISIKHEKYPNLVKIGSATVEFTPQLIDLKTTNISVGTSRVKRFETSLKKPVAIYKEGHLIDAKVIAVAPYLDFIELKGEKPKSAKPEDNQQIKNLALNTQVEFAPDMLTDSTAKKDILVKLSRFHFEHDTLSQDFLLTKGRIHLLANELKVEYLTGKINRSDFELDLDIKNLEAFQKKELDTLNIEFGLASDFLDLKKLSWGKADLPPIKQLSLKGNVNASNQWLHEPKSLPYLLLKFEELKGLIQPLNQPLTIDDFLLKINKDVIRLDRFHLIYAKTELKADAEIRHPDKLIEKDYKNVELTARIVSDHLNIDDLAPLWEGENEAEKDTSQAEPKEKPKEKKEHIITQLPEFDVILDLKQLTYQGMFFDTVYTKVLSLKQQKIMMDPLKVVSGKGIINGAGELEGQADGGYELRSNIKIKELDLSKTIGEIQAKKAGEKDLQVYGILNSDVTVRLDIDPYGKVVLDSSKAVLQFDLNNGRIKNFEPFMALAVFFKTSEMRDLQFEKLVNIVSFDGKIIQIPGMWVKTNAGDIFMSGQQGIKGNMDYHVALPFRALNTMPVNFINSMPKTMLVETPEKVMGSADNLILGKLLKLLKLNMLRDTPNESLAGFSNDEVIKDENGEYVSVTDTKMVNSQLFLRVQGSADDINVSYDVGQFTQKWKRTLIENPQNFMKTFEPADPDITE